MILEEINISTQELQALALLDRFVKVAETECWTFGSHAMITSSAMAEPFCRTL